MSGAGASQRGAEPPIFLQADSMADALMPPGVRSLRMMLHATAVEVLLYLTPLHCQDMLDSLVDSLNLQFHKFQRRNPTFCVSPPLFVVVLAGLLVRDHAEMRIDTVAIQRAEASAISACLQ